MPAADLHEVIKTVHFPVQVEQIVQRDVLYPVKQYSDPSNSCLASLLGLVHGVE